MLRCYIQIWKALNWVNLYSVKDFKFSVAFSSPTPFLPPLPMCIVANYLDLAPSSARCRFVHWHQDIFIAVGHNDGAKTGVVCVDCVFIHWPESVKHQCLFIPTHTHTHIHKSMHALMQTQTHTQKCTHTYKHTQACMHTYTHTHTNTQLWHLSTVE